MALTITVSLRVQNFPQISEARGFKLIITCCGAVDLSPGSDEDVDAVVGVGAGDIRREEVEFDVLSPGWETEHQTTLLNINICIDTLTPLTKYVLIEGTGRGPFLRINALNI